MATRPTTILVVDDEPGVRAMLKEALEVAGYRVVLAAGGAEALAYVRGHRRDDPPALVLTDLLMPGMDGFALVAQLRLAGYTGRVLLMSAGYGESPMPEFPFVRKPFDLPALRDKIRELLRD
jgi:CheY-like chemotaxis protein